MPRRGSKRALDAIRGILGDMGHGAGQVLTKGPGAAASGVASIPGRAADQVGRMGDALGGSEGGLAKGLFGESGKQFRFDRFNEQQQGALSDILGQSMDQFQGSDFSFGPIADRARKQFEERTVPSLAERFTGLGGQRSSAFGQQAGQAGADLESQLAAMESQFGLEEGNLLQSLMGLGLTPQFENVLSPRQPGFIENTISGLMPGVGKGLGKRIGGV